MVADVFLVGLKEIQCQQGNGMMIDRRSNEGMVPIWK